MHYLSVVTLRALAVVLAIWPTSYALHHLWKTGDMFMVLPAASGLLVGYALWFWANRMMERQGSAIPF